MKATISIVMDGAAFDGYDDVGALELAEILKDLAKHVAYGERERVLCDSYGNRVGQFKITGGGQWTGGE
jgi:hypothetical protein